MSQNILNFKSVFYKFKYLKMNEKYNVRYGNPKQNYLEIVAAKKHSL